jgi:hypothetical protein
MTHLLHACASYPPLTRLYLLHASYTPVPLTRLLHACISSATAAVRDMFYTGDNVEERCGTGVSSYTPYTPLTRPLHAPYTPLTRLLHASYTPLRV